MLIQTALDLVGQLIYRPGWEFTATDHSSRFEGSICVRVDYPAQETSRTMALKGYPESYGLNNRPYALFPIVVRDLDNIGLYAAILQAIAQIDIHEAREYLRIHPTGWAPFHPHQIDGMRRWAERHNADVIADLQFGIA